MNVYLFLAFTINRIHHRSQWIAKSTAHLRVWLGYVYPSRAGLISSSLDKSSKRFINPKFSHVAAENDRPIPARSSPQQLRAHGAKRTDHVVHALTA